MVVLATHQWPAAGTDAGAAAPVAVLVHGMSSWSRTWWRVGPALAKCGWRVIAVDQRGHGRSPRVPGATTIEEAAADLEAAIEQHATAPVDVLIGHSLGAAVSMRLAHRRPSIARRLVLEDPPGIDRSVDEEFLVMADAGMEAARVDPDGEVARALAQNPSWREEDARYDVEGRALADADALIASLRGKRTFTVAGLAAEMRLPTLYLLADEDRSVLAGSARERLRANLPPASELVELDSGHNCHRDSFDEYMATLLGWLGARVAA